MLYFSCKFQFLFERKEDEGLLHAITKELGLMRALTISTPDSQDHHELQHFVSKREKRRNGDPRVKVL